MWLDALWAWGTLSVWPRTTQQASLAISATSESFEWFPRVSRFPRKPKCTWPSFKLIHSISPCGSWPTNIALLTAAQGPVAQPGPSKSPMVEGQFSFQTHRITDSEWCLNIDHPFLGSFRCPTWDCLKHLGKKSKKISG